VREPRHASIQRNLRLAQTFYYAGLVERWGTGTARIAEACRERGLPEPTFEASADRFTVTFSRDPDTEERLGGGADRAADAHRARGEEGGKRQ
jgi:ATP-dependent DNA helicase RecG